MMKKTLTVLMAAAAAASLAACGSGKTASTTAAAAPSEAEETTAGAPSAAGSTETAGGSAEGSLSSVSLTFGTTALFAPFTYYDTDGKTLIGFDMDYMKALKDYLGFSLNGDPQVMNYSAITASLSANKLDMGMAALCATDERKAVMNFSDTYYDTGQVVMINKETSPAEITGTDALKDGKYTVGVEKGTASHLYAQANYPAGCIKVYDTITEAYLDLENGANIQALLQDDANAAYYIKTTDSTKLEIVGDIFNRGQSPYAIALSFSICDKYPEIVDDFNRGIAALKENGTYDTLYDRWLK
jgi:ABC-type amino acid transport substrate-binding protein